MSLFLVGLRGAGKSTVARLAARRLGVIDEDADALVERRCGRTIAELFAREGERAFRALEREVLLGVLPRRGLIVATGGGCVLDAALRVALRRHGGVVWLRAPSEVLAQRIAGGARPALHGRSATEELEALRREREPLYARCADAVVHTGEHEPEEVARVIEQLWTVLPHHDLR